jgi:hypothetical protein
MRRTSALSMVLLLAVLTVAQKPAPLPKATKVYEKIWSDDRATRFHWECKPGSHVYWYEVNAVGPNDGEMVPECRPDSEHWKQITRSR